MNFLNAIMNVAAVATPDAVETLPTEAADKLLASFRYMGIGMLGVFAVAAVLICSVLILNKISGKKANKKDK